MQAFANKTALFVMQQVRASLGNVPVMFVVGNNDSYTGTWARQHFSREYRGTVLHEFCEWDACGLSGIFQ